MLTQERLKELFNYREDGFLIRRTNEGQRGRVGDLVGCLDNTGYLTVGVDEHKYLVHRLIWFWHHGYLPENLLDHKDRIKINNWIDNLREVGHQCNIRNIDNPKTNTSGVKGVIWSKANNKWMAFININKKQYYLGYFIEFDEAVANRLAHEQSINWDGCDNSSPAYQYIQSISN